MQLPNQVLCLRCQVNINLLGAYFRLKESNYIGIVISLLHFLNHPLVSSRKPQLQNAVLQMHPHTHAHPPSQEQVAPWSVRNTSPVHGYNNITEGISPREWSLAPQCDELAHTQVVQCWPHCLAFGWGSSVTSGVLCGPKLSHFFSIFFFFLFNCLTKCEGCGAGCYSGCF